MTSDPVTMFSAELGRSETPPRTIAALRSDLRLSARWLADSTGDVFTPQAVTRSDIRGYRGHLQTVAAATPATINRRLATLRKFFAWAQASGVLDHDAEMPTRDVAGVEAIQLAPRSLDKRDVDRFIRTVERHGSTRDRALVEVLRHTGLRVGELCALRLGDVEISDRKGSAVVRWGKGGKARTVPLNADARRAVGDYLNIRPMVAGDWLFVGQRGDGLRPHGVQELFVKYGRLAGVTLTPHTLRHSFARHALDAGVDLVAVSKLLGHERLETTARYTVPSARDLEKAVESLETY